MNTNGHEWGKTEKLWPRMNTNGPEWGKTEKLWPRMNTNGHEWEKPDTGPLADARGAGWTGKTEKLWPRMNTNGHEWEKTDTGPPADARGSVLGARHGPRHECRGGRQECLRHKDRYDRESGRSWFESVLNARCAFVAVQHSGYG